MSASNQFFSNWWVVGFCALCLIGYIEGMKSRSLMAQELKFKISEMEKEVHLSSQENEELSLQLASRDDPAWIELVLLKQVGVVPDGFLKVHFTK